MLSVRNTFGLVCLVLASTTVESIPQGYKIPDDTAQSIATGVKEAAKQAFIEVCPCFDHAKMCATPDMDTTEASTNPTTMPSSEREPKALDATIAPEENPENPTTMAPEISAETTMAPETPKSPEQVFEGTTESVPAATTAPAPADPATTPKQPEVTEAPEDAQNTTEKPQDKNETLDPTAPPAEPPIEDSKRTPKKLEEPADINPVPEPNPNSQMNAPGVDQSTLDALTKLLNELNEKLRKLEESHDNLNKNIGLLEDRLKEYEKLIPDVQNTTTNALAKGNPEQAVEQWKNLQTVIDDPEQLQNVTNDIVSNACDANVSPPDTMNFIHNLPTTDTNIVDSAYNTLADKMTNSEPLQEQLYWRDMTPYCQAVAQDIGNNAPTTQKMYNLQNQMRKNAAQPIRQCSNQINQQQYEPALNTWNNMTVDIADDPNQLKNNMQKLVLKSYDDNADSLPYVFQFIWVLPDSQVEYKDAAYDCLRIEMNANGHSFIYKPQNGLQQQQQPQQRGNQAPQENVYNYRNH